MITKPNATRLPMLIGFRFIDELFNNESHRY